MRLAESLKRPYLSETGEFGAICFFTSYLILKKVGNQPPFWNQWWSTGKKMQPNMKHTVVEKPKAWIKLLHCGCIDWRWIIEATQDCPGWVKQALQIFHSPLGVYESLKLVHPLFVQRRGPQWQHGNKLSWIVLGHNNAGFLQFATLGEPSAKNKVDITSTAKQDTFITSQMIF